MTNRTHNQKKLVALDQEGLDALAAYTQDSIITVRDMTFLPQEQRFVLTMKRFVWEKDKRKGNERRQSALHFERVRNVQTKNIRREKSDAVLNLLTIRFEAKEPPSGYIELVFSDNGVIRLDVECIEAQLSDLSGAWETQSRPEHEA